MARRFAIGEVHSEFFYSKDESIKQETIKLLTSGNHELECRGIQKHTFRRRYIVDLPNDTQWHIAQLRLSEEEFARLRTVKITGWEEYTNGSFKLIDAANYLDANPNRDPRVAAVISACEKGKLCMYGITLLGKTLTSPLTIVEGTARLVAIYLKCVQNKSSPLCTEKIEVVIGLSDSTWCFSP